MSNANLPAARQIDLSAQYGCPATMTVVTFIACGLVHRARRLWRSDMPTTGLIELYTLCPYNTSDSSTDECFLDSTFSEDWFRYVDEFSPSRVDCAAMDAIAAVDGSAYRVESLAAASCARFAAMEM